MNLVQNSNFSSTANWTCSPSWDSNNYAAVAPPFLEFSYATLGAVLVSQSVILPKSAQSYQFRVNVACFWGGYFSMSAAFYDSGNLLLGNIGGSYACNPLAGISSYSTISYVFNTTTNMYLAVLARITLSGQDSRDWLGLYGPEMTNIQLFSTPKSITGSVCAPCPPGAYSGVVGRFESLSSQYTFIFHIRLKLWHIHVLQGLQALKCANFASLEPTLEWQVGNKDLDNPVIERGLCCDGGWNDNIVYLMSKPYDIFSCKLQSRECWFVF